MVSIRLIAASLFVIGMVGIPQRMPTEGDQGVPVLVELFTAEGCSTCPPADKLLEGMIASQPAAGVTIVGLGEHVDYWDRLGWKDRFSSAAFTRRQQQYADRDKGDNIYTPQMVVDGKSAFVGTDIAAARQAIEQAGTASHGVVQIELDTSSANHVGVAVTASKLSVTAEDHADVIIALTEDSLRTDVKRGENKGRTLTHAAVVRQMTTVGEAAEGATLRADIKVESGWQRQQLKTVAFVQQRQSRRILATAVAKVD